MWITLGKVIHNFGKTSREVGTFQLKVFIFDEVVVLRYYKCMDNQEHNLPQQDASDPVDGKKDSAEESSRSEAGGARPDSRVKP